MAIILVRYCEIGLKSAPVRAKFENQLKDNILTMLAGDRREAFVTKGEARFFVESEDLDGCITSLKKVFGIASISVAASCSADMDDICRTAAQYSIGRIGEGQSFAVRARREGTHTYTSMDVGREAGSAIFIQNEDLGVKVDLHIPDITFYVEIRNNKSFIFDRYINCPGGLPMGSQGKIIGVIDDKRSVLAAWLMMKRGCRVFVTGDGDMSVLRMYDPMLKVLGDTESNGGYVREVLGKVTGTSIANLSDIDYSGFDLPVFFPTIGMTDGEVESMLDNVRASSF